MTPNHVEWLDALSLLGIRILHPCTYLHSWLWVYTVVKVDHETRRYSYSTDTIEPRASAFESHLSGHYACNDQPERLDETVEDEQNLLLTVVLLQFHIWQGRSISVRF